MTGTVSALTQKWTVATTLTLVWLLHERRHWKYWIWVFHSVWKYLILPQSVTIQTYTVISGSALATCIAETNAGLQAARLCESVSKTTCREVSNRQLAQLL